VHTSSARTAESGIAEYTIKASFIDPKAKYNKIKIKNNARALQPLIWL
jgi:hypothetical protein